MTDDYKVVFQVDSRCENRLKKENISIDKIIEKIMQYAVSFYENGIDAHIHRLMPAIQNRLYFDTTLFIVKIGAKERALVTIDVDEIFDQLIITMWGYTATHDWEAIFKRLGESIYQQYLNQEEE